jgi:predicted DNA-binding transcriptional regulator YafY
MPQNKNAQTRYRAIDLCLAGKRNKYPTLEQLAAACSRAIGEEVATSTIEKDLRTMKEPYPRGFDAPIKYHKLHKGYYYDEMGFSIAELQLEEEEWEALAYASNLLYQYKEVPLFHNFKEAIEKINARFSIPFAFQDEAFEQLVQFETGHSTTGYEWLKDCYNAIKQQYAVEFTYENIYKQQCKRYRLQPCLLREYRNRWYLIGWEAERKNYLTFALDRVQELTVVPERQAPRKDFNPSLFLQHSMGIMEGDGTATTVELEVAAPYDQLVQLAPLHPTQQAVRTNRKGTVYRLQVNLNPELYQRILAYGPHCKVKKPAVLQQAIRAQLEAALQHYT